MKKAALLLFFGVLCLSACRKDVNPETPIKDASLTGTSVDVSAISGKTGKLFVLNEGQMGTNGASLDFLRFDDGTYVTGAFKKMNPDVGAGLGDVGNDIAVKGDEAWIVVNNSGLVEVISATNERESAAITIPSPRFIAFDDTYAYVTSYAGAYINYDGNYNVTDSSNPKGKVYRIAIQNREVKGSVEVGYQPEGIAVYGGKLYVANSGGFSSSLAPDYAYDKTVSVIDAATFKVTKTLTLTDNLQRVYSDGNGNIYVTSFGIYGKVPSSIWRINAGDGDKVSKIADNVSVSAISGDTVYWIGSEDGTWKGNTCRNGVKGSFSINLDGVNPYGLAVLDKDVMFVSDAGDYVNPGTVNMFVGGSKKWSVTAGICPGHFAIY